MNHILNQALKLVKDNSHHILSVGAVIGTGATAYFSGRAAYRTAVNNFENEMPLKEVVKENWKEYVPAGLAFVGTTICIVGSNRISSRKIVAATMAYSLSEKAFTTYKEKVVEQLGDKKEKTLRDEIASEKVRNNPPPAIILPPGDVICQEGHTGRYFNSNMEHLMQSVNKLNAQMLRYEHATLDDFYELVGLKPTQQSHDFGWEVPDLLTLDCTAVMNEDGRPCLVFNYNYLKQL